MPKTSARKVDKIKESLFGLYYFSKIRAFLETNIGFQNHTPPSYPKIGLVSN